jgi:hypothetical protein
VAREMYGNTFTEAIRLAFQEVRQLAYEMEEQYENAPEWAQHSEANQRRVATSAILGAAREPDVPASLRGDSHVVDWWEKQSNITRPVRRDNVVSCLRACLAYLSTLSIEDTDDLKQELEKAIEWLNKADFPPMFPSSGRRKSR